MTEFDINPLVERAKDLLRIGQALVRAEVEQTPQAQLVLTWSVGRRAGERVSRVTLWRLRLALGLVSARGNNQHQAKAKSHGRRDSKRAVVEVRP